MKADAARAAYLDEAASWDRDRVAEMRRAARRAWWIAGVAVGVATTAVIAVMLLTPLKSVQPFVIRVDNSTGIVDVVPEYSARGEMPEAVTRYLLGQYVTLRERYFYAMAETDYAEVGALQSAQLNQAWLTAWDRNSPNSPLTLYRDGTTVRAQVKAISFLARANGLNDLAQVRFLTATRRGGSGEEQIAHFIATIQYSYATPSKDEKQRSMNPLGFRVLDYRKEPEVIETPASTGTTVAVSDGAGR